MKKYSLGPARVIGVRVVCGLAVLSVAACNKGKNNTASLSQDSTLTKDLQLASADSSAQPKLGDTAATTPATPVAPPAAPAAPAPAPAAKPAATVHHKTHHTAPSGGSTNTSAVAAPAKVSDTSVSATGNTVVRNQTPTGGGNAGVVASGTTIVLAAGSQICTNTNHVGDRFTATVSDAVLGSNGAAIPAGSGASGHVVALAPSNNATQAVVVQLAIDALSVNGTSVPVNAEVVSAQVNKKRATSTQQDATKVGAGAVAGGILGGLIGHDAKGAVIGAAAGAAAGGAVAVSTAKFQGCVPQGGKITIKLDSDTPIRS
jgi:hypothetical protein